MSTALPTSYGLPPLPHELRTEVVERKGVGHPDTLADGIAELAAIRYSAYCLAEFGAVLHHNLDKVAVLGGRARFGEKDGTYGRPLRVVFGGRASSSYAGRQIPVRDILQAAAADYLREALPGFEQVKWEVHHETTDSSKFRTWFSPRSFNDLPERPVAYSNDTAYLVATAGRSAAETVALLTESWMRQYPWVGSDIKALVVRERSAVTVTTCVPALAGEVSSSEEFGEALADAARTLTAHIVERLPEHTVRVVCNSKDTGRGPVSGQYFTVSGSSVDFGEDGLVGRGNARSGLITPNQMAGNEVLFGKNAAYHVGKVGGWLVDEAAAALSRDAGPSRVAVMWRNGARYNDPASIEITTDRPGAMGARQAQEVVRATLERTDWMADLVERRRYLPQVIPVQDLLAELGESGTS
ncbi:methionine adenosyltransferase [Streptomyces sp. NPDC087440]|uniref:methionine adenosyltransferase n=1 Tax=Streptomyces sp. NPDC087440 TaxID=3365790 RepID=UPI0037F6F9EE